jgi:alkylation response protein AidB-like acyl-CoA dehydrogenase
MRRIPGRSASVTVRVTRFSSGVHDPYTDGAPRTHRAGQARPAQSIFGGTNEIMKEIIGRSLGL